MHFYTDESIECNFDEAYICGYRSYPAPTGFSWKRSIHYTFSDYTGPKGDHTYTSHTVGMCLRIFQTISIKEDGCRRKHFISRH